MKTLTAIILLLTTSITINATTTDLYTHAREVRLKSYFNQKDVKNGSKKLFFAMRGAKNGNPRAELDLAKIYAIGKEVKRDERKAFYWFHKSALAGNVEAKYYMGVSFLQGRGVKRDIHLARYWFKQAAKAGHQRAIYNLSKIEQSLFKTNGYKNYYSKR